MRRCSMPRGSPPRAERWASLPDRTCVSVPAGRAVYRSEELGGPAPPDGKVTNYAHRRSVRLSGGRPGTLFVAVISEDRSIDWRMSKQINPSQ